MNNREAKEQELNNYRKLLMEKIINPDWAKDDRREYLENLFLVENELKEIQQTNECS